MTEFVGAARAFAEALAQEATAMLTAATERRPSARIKSPGDWSTELDARIEDHIRERIAKAFPTHSFLGEEGGFSHPSARRRRGSGDELLWVADPIDGTVNFTRGYPQYSVAIALLDHGEPVVGCIADPCRGELFSGALGQGAVLNGRPLSVSATVDLGQALAATVFPKPDAAFMGSYLARFGTVVRALAGVRRAGSMALELAYLAAGRVDCFWQRGMGPWDAAAGVLLIREAGGCIFTLDGLPWMQSQEVCAAGPGVADEWKALLLDC
ncbi:inositol monophosphatase family protein [Variovorax humicola]|uniref:Inositol-1-monophosphatase n=1 Tax=Variovorax humicola TaxID=1769758 RepID=A0ABU8W3J5_9BURK